MRICHLTSVHSRFDIRVFQKMCRSIAGHGWDAILVVADGKGDAVVDGVQIYDVGSSKGRLDRLRNAPRRIFEKALSLSMDIYHLHDPELIPIGLKLKSRGYKVIFDAHEDAPKQMLSKPYLNPVMRWVVSKSLAAYEYWSCRKLDAVIAATPFIRDKFIKLQVQSVDINNYPLLGELDSGVSWENKGREVSYVGGIALVRGIREMVEAMNFVNHDIRLNLCGSFSEPGLEDQCSASNGWRQVNKLGVVDRQGVKKVLARSVAGIVTLHPVPNHIESQPIKMFEYMSAGVPVIASDFPLWREIVVGNDCGVCVDPLDPKAIAQAVNYLVDNPGVAERMGGNGRKAVTEKYNWGVEESKLLNFYLSI